ncbi:hypothetical protein LIA77_03219 [Sarocladium implicatum]|nr:hypothetical protein LIA77_03219 [Sarocladium implicatum]
MKFCLGIIHRLGKSRNGRTFATEFRLCGLEDSRRRGSSVRSVVTGRGGPVGPKVCAQSAAAELSRSLELKNCGWPPCHSRREKCFFRATALTIVTATRRAWKSLPFHLRACLLRYTEVTNTIRSGVRGGQGHPELLAEATKTGDL